MRTFLDALGALVLIVLLFAALGHVAPRGKHWSHIDYGRRLGRKR